MAACLARCRHCHSYARCIVIPMLAFIVEHSRPVPDAVADQGLHCRYRSPRMAASLLSSMPTHTLIWSSCWPPAHQDPAGLQRTCYRLASAVPSRPCLPGVQDAFHSCLLSVDSQFHTHGGTSSARHAEILGTSSLLDEQQAHACHIMHILGCRHACLPCGWLL